MNVIPMISRCIELQWKGLPPRLKEAIIKANAMYDWSNSLSFGQQDYAIWTSENTYSIKLMSIKEEFIYHYPEIVEEMDNVHRNNPR